MRRRQRGMPKMTTQPPTQSPEDKNRRPARPPPTAHVARGRIYTLLSAFCIALVFLLLKRGSNAELPDVYAVCSRKNTHSAIYTADASSPTVDCIVVHHDRIADRGTLEDVRRVWGDKMLQGPPVSKNPLAPKSGIVIKFLKEGQALYPGFSDAHAHVLGEDTPCWMLYPPAHSL